MRTQPPAQVFPREDSDDKDFGSATDPDFVVNEAKPVDAELVGSEKHSNPSPDDDRPEEIAGLQDDDREFVSAPLGSMPADDPSPKPKAPDQSNQGFSPQQPDPPEKDDSEAKASTTEIRINPDFLGPDRSSGQSLPQPEPPQPRAQPNEQYLSPEEKQELLQRVSTVQQATGETPPAKHIPSERPSQPEIGSGSSTAEHSTRTRRALFFRNFIQLSGPGSILENDRFVISDTEYVLKRRKLDLPLMIILGTPLLALLLVLAIPSLLPSGDAGNGRMIGMVIDEYSRPIGAGAVVQIEETGDRYRTNADGFFVSDPLPGGVYNVNFLFQDEPVGSIQATVAEGEVTTITVRPSPETVKELTTAEPLPSAPTPSAGKPRANASKARATSRQRASSSSSTKKTSPTKPGKIKLAASVEGAKLTLNGSVLGAGNLTYSDIKPGTYRYSVTAEGYEGVTGELSVPSGRTKTLNVSLSPLSQERKAEEYTADDFYYSGIAALRDGDLTSAVTDLSEAIRREPSHASAFWARAEAQNGLQSLSEAHDDYIRAAELFRFQKSQDQALKAYNRAVTIDQKSLEGHLGRASLFLAKGETLAAIADFESATHLNKDSYDAHFGLGKARYQRSQYGKAIESLERCRDLQPQSLAVYHYLMLAYMADSDYDKVKKTYDRFAEVADDNDLRDLRSSPTYAAVVRIVDNH